MRPSACVRCVTACFFSSPLPRGEPFMVCVPPPPLGPRTPSPAHRLPQLPRKGRGLPRTLASLPISELPRLCRGPWALVSVTLVSRIPLWFDGGGVPEHVAGRRVGFLPGYFVPTPVDPLEPRVPGSHDLRSNSESVSRSLTQACVAGKSGVSWTLLPAGSALTADLGALVRRWPMLRCFSPVTAHCQEVPFLPFRWGLRKRREKIRTFSPFSIKSLLILLF